MSASVVAMRDDGAPSREPNGICDACGRRGTVARATLETEPRQIWRWCARCAPREVKRFERERDEENARWFAHVRTHAGGAHFAPVPAPPGGSVKWETWRGRLYFIASIVRSMLQRNKERIVEVPRS